MILIKQNLDQMEVNQNMVFTLENQNLTKICILTLQPEMHIIGGYIYDHEVINKFDTKNANEVISFVSQNNPMCMLEYAEEKLSINEFNAILDCFNFNADITDSEESSEKIIFC